MEERLSSFAEFWPDYLGQHRRRATRAVHYAGTVLGCLLLIGFFDTGALWLLVAAPVAGYAPAWLAHLTIEHNRPATFRHPLWSFAGDFRMLGLAASGRLGPELARIGAR